MDTFFQNLTLDQLLWQLQTQNVGHLVQNPWFLTAIGLLAVVALLMRWRVLLVAILSLTGFVALTVYTLQQETALSDLSAENLLLFAGGGLFIVLAAIYFLFIHGD